MKYLCSKWSIKMWTLKTGVEKLGVIPKLIVFKIHYNLWDTLPLVQKLISFVDYLFLLSYVHGFSRIPDRSSQI